MKRLVVSEHQRIQLGLTGDLSPAEAECLRRFDELHAERTGGTVFDWSRVNYVKARGYVGVIQVPGPIPCWTSFPMITCC